MRCAPRAFSIVADVVALVAGVQCIEREVQFKHVDSRLSQKSELAVFSMGIDELLHLRF